MDSIGTNRRVFTKRVRNWNRQFLTLFVSDYGDGDGCVSQKKKKILSFQQN